MPSMSAPPAFISSTVSSNSAIQSSFSRVVSSTPSPYPTISTFLPSCSFKSKTTTKKKFVCDFVGCGKTFSRSEHLHRHALNHKDGDNTCVRCMAHFRRRDLLDRHMARHKEKDDEAGGEGLGILATRKRLWRDENGNIVNSRRPTFILKDFIHSSIQPSGKVKSEPIEEQNLPQLIKPIALSSNFASSVVFPTETVIMKNEMPGLLGDIRCQELQHNSWLKTTALPSPPTSEPDISRIETKDNLDPFYDKSWSMMHNIVENDPTINQQAKFTITPSWETHSYQVMGSVPEVIPHGVLCPNTELHGWQSWNSPGIKF